MKNLVKESLHDNDIYMVKRVNSLVRLLYKMSPEDLKKFKDLTQNFNIDQLRVLISVITKTKDAGNSLDQCLEAMEDIIGNILKYKNAGKTELNI